jgi:hypothetical protein
MRWFKLFTFPDTRDGANSPRPLTKKMILEFSRSLTYELVSNLHVPIHVRWFYNPLLVHSPGHSQFNKLPVKYLHLTRLQKRHEFINTHNPGPAANNRFKSWGGGGGGTSPRFLH